MAMTIYNRLTIKSPTIFTILMGLDETEGISNPLDSVSKLQLLVPVSTVNGSACPRAYQHTLTDAYADTTADEDTDTDTRLCERTLSHIALCTARLSAMPVDFGHALSIVFARRLR
eukprot:12533277-Alexandrium_andersonii.AAC.1